jgi:hypothetical protein
MEVTKSHKKQQSIYDTNPTNQLFQVSEDVPTDSDASEQSRYIGRDSLPQLNPKKSKMIDQIEGYYFKLEAKSQTQTNF